MSYQYHVDLAAIKYGQFRWNTTDICSGDMKV